MTDMRAPIYYPGSAPEDLARTEGFWRGEFQGKEIGLQEGLRKGREEGYSEGHEDGFNQGRNQGHNQGYQAGKRDGWSEAVTAGNKVIKEANTRIEKLDNENADLFQKFQEQRQHIERLTEKLNAMERENANLKQNNKKVSEVVVSFQAANERLIKNLAERDEQLSKKTKEAAGLIREYNRHLILINSMRESLETIAHEQGEQAQRVREAFVRQYCESVWFARHESKGDHLLHQDPAFEKEMPKTYRFMMEVLEHVGYSKDIPFDLQNDIDNLMAFTPEYTEEMCSP